MSRPKICLFLVVVIAAIACLFAPAPAGAGGMSLGNGVNDNAGLNWTTGNSTGVAGAKDWSVVTVATSTLGDGWAARSGAIESGENSSLTTTVTLTAPGTMAFYQKVSSELTNDKLSFFIDNVQKSTISGEIPWQQKYFPLTTGTHTLQWKYSKNTGSIVRGLDAAWIDRVSVSPDTLVTVVAPNGGAGQKLQAGTTVEIIWNAPARAEKYSLFYTVNGTSWLPIQGAANLTSSRFSNITFPWTVPAPATGNSALCKVKVIAYNGLNAIVGQDSSNAAFTIEVLKVTALNTGGVVVNPKAGPVAIDYTIYGQEAAASAAYSYSVSGGTSWLPIATVPGALAPGAHTYSWTVPFQTALKTTCRVKVDIKNNAGAVIGSDMNDVNFSILPTYGISGLVTRNGKALSGVTITLGGKESNSAVTDVYGKYTFTKLLPGSYTVSAAKTGFAFNPAVLNVTITTANNTTTNFTAFPTSSDLYAISGVVTGSTKTGIAVALTGPVSGTAWTDTNGNFTFANLPIGYYTVTPAKTGFTFSPLSVAGLVDSSTSDLIFTSSTNATANFSVAGKVTLNGVGLPGVTVNATGTVLSATVVTDPLGNYIIKGLKSGACTITPSKDGFTFTPGTVQKTLAANLTGVNFTSFSSATYAISGRILTKSGGPAPNITVTLNTSPVRTATTDGSGNYSFGNLPNGIYTVTPSPGTYSALFAPLVRTVAVSGGDALDQDFTVSVLFTVSGTVSYTGTRTGRIYLNLAGQNSGSIGRGTSISAPGAFTIRGVEPGDYTIEAYRDNIGSGARNASNPVGVSGVFTVGYANKTGVAVTLTNPPLVNAPAPADLSGFPSNKSAFISWEAPRNENYLETATAYKLYWRAGSPPSKTVYDGVKTVTARDDVFFFHGGLTNGAALYYIVTSVSVDNTESAASAPFGPIVIGPSGEGGSTVSGTISFAPATGPLYVGMYSDKQGIFFTRFDSAATSPQTYTIAHVPDGLWHPFAFIDVNNNGVNDIGDTANLENLSPPVAVSGQDKTVNLVLRTANAFAGVRTGHFKQDGYDSYGLSLRVAESKNLPVKVAITGAPNLPVPIDLGNGWGNFETWIDFGQVRPSVGDAYTYSVTYKNGTVETLNASVTAVLDSFPAGLSVSSELTPTFSWAAPASPPDQYVYEIEVRSEYNTIWQYPEDSSMPSTQTSVRYNVDGNAYLQALTADQPYSYGISVRDGNENFAELVSNFVGGVGAAAGYSISGTVSGSSVEGVTVTLSGDAAASTTTSSGGDYSFSNLAPGSYTVSPAKNGYSFLPLSQAITLTSADMTGIDFTSSAVVGPTYGISGTVSGSGGGLPDVVMTLSGLGSALTDASGHYSFNLLSNGTYTVTPALNGYSFTPPSRAVSINGGNGLADFTANALPPASVVNISGTVTYSGSKTGRVYINIENARRGTSLNVVSSGTYTFAIHGVPAGTYDLAAFMDNLGRGVRNASNPSGSAANVNASSGDVTGVAISLSDHSPATPATPTGLIASPGNQSAFVGWDAVYDDKGLESAVTYSLYSKVTDSSCDVSTSSYDGVTTIPAMDDTHFFQDDLVDGTKICYVITATNQAGSSAASAAFGPVTIGAPVGLNTVAGSITFPAGGSGPVYVGLYSDAQGVRITQVPSLSSAQTYTISGIPDGEWNLFAFVDKNDDHLIDLGDVAETENLAPPFMLAGSETRAQDLALTARDATAKTSVIHFKSGTEESYAVNFQVRGDTKLPVKASLVSGPGISGPVDMLKDSWSHNAYVAVDTRPISGQTYTIDVTYSDNSVVSLPSEVSGVLDSFVRNMTVSTGLTTTFSWDPPASPPQNYRYQIQVSGNGVWWNYPQDGGTTQTSVVYNADGNAPALAPGQTYQWLVTVRDQSTGNGATNFSQFTTAMAPGTYSISGSVNGDITQGVSVSLTGESIAPASMNTDSSGNYLFMNLDPGTYTVTPAHENYTFTPSSSSVTVTDANRNGLNFIALLNTSPSYTLTVSKTGTGTGKVTSQPGGIDCGATCSSNFSAPVTLTASPDNGSDFAGWSNNCTVSSQDGLQCSVSMDQSKTITATFNLGRLKWSSNTGESIYYSSPAIGPDGTIYVGDGSGVMMPSGTERGVYAFNPNGTLKWKYAGADKQKMFTPAVGPDGTIYVQDEYSTLYALTSDGTLTWTYTRYKSGNVGQTAPAIAADGTIYFGGDNLFAINPDGTLKWSAQDTNLMLDIIRSSPALAPDGTIYVGINGLAGKALVAFNTNGTMKWKYMLTGANWVFSSPAIGTDGTIYIGAETGSGGGNVYAVNPDGTEKWTYPVTDLRVVRSSPVVGADGTIYIGTKSGASVNAALLALNPDGSLKWDYPVEYQGADIYGTAAVGADGTIYFGAETGYLYALKPDGTLLWKYSTNNGINWTSPAISADGTLYVGNNNGTLFALRTSSMGLAGSSWPKFRHDDKNSGRLEAFTISGSITNLSGQSGSIRVCATTDPTFNSACTYSALASSGTYTITNAAAGAYYVGAFQDVDDDTQRDTTEPQGVYTTMPATQVTVSTGDVTGLDFSISTPDNSIMGAVTNLTPKSGSTYVCVTTDSTFMSPCNYTGVVTSGTYSVTYVQNGTYYVGAFQDENSNGELDVNEPEGVYTTKPPTAVAVNNGDRTGIDFTITGPTYSLSGRVSGDVADGVTMSLGGDATAETLTTSGTYTFANLAPGTYSVTPSKDGYVFSPGSWSGTLSGNRGDIDFTSGASYSISGVVTNFNPRNGDTLICITTDSSFSTFPCNYGVKAGGNGSYTVTGVPAGTYYVGAVQDSNGNTTPDMSEPQGAYTNMPATAVLVNANQSNINFNIALPVYSISGTVTRTASKTGRVYLALDNGAGRGTSVNLSSGPTSTTFTIRGVTPGTYAISAFLDNVGKGRKNASNPVGSVSGISVTSANITGVSISLADPAPVTPATPAGLAVSPGKQSAFVSWDTVRDDNRIETAQTYTLYWTVNGACYDAATIIASANGSVSIPAIDDGHYFHSGLADDDVACYVMTANGEGGSSAASNVAGPATISVNSGMNIVTGTIDAPPDSTGPLYVGLYSKTQGIHYTVISSVLSSQTYTISGMPDDTWHPFAVVDNNNNGLIDVGDFANTETLAPAVTLSGFQTKTLDLELTGAGAFTRAKTRHKQNNGGNDYYQVDLELSKGKKLPVKAVITEGPSMLPPADMAFDGWGFSGGLPDIAQPITGQTYTVKVIYSDGTNEFMPATVTGVLNDFAVPGYPTAANNGNHDLTPNFTWSEPGAHPDFYGYLINAYPDGGGQGWWYPQQDSMPAGTTSVLYNADGNAQQPALSQGQKYWWEITLYDSTTGNSSTSQVDFTP